MPTTMEDIREWFKEGKREKAKWMFVVCDSFSHEDYPAYAKTDKEFWEKYEHYNGKNMQHIMETYDLQADMKEQIQGGMQHRMPVSRAV